jgi:KAP family P-loop domain
MSDTALRSLGTFAGVEFAIALTQEPWTLDVDTLVVSVGETLGSLASAVRSHLPDAGWESVNLGAVRADSPALLVSRRPSAPPLTIILATVHASPETRPSPAEAVFWIPTAVRASLVAAPAGSDRMVLPLFGVGRLQVPIKLAAQAVVSSALDVVEKSKLPLPSLVAFLADTESAAAVIRDTWVAVLGAHQAAAPAGPQEKRAAPPPESGGGPYEPPETAEPDTLAGGVHADLVDPDLGIPREKDDLGVSSYVSMLATAVAAKDTRLPLSIGLFGEWGSGKSYFMGLLRSQVAALNGSGDAYCAGIEQIGFNAWTYADTNLWASLGDEIFRSLAHPAEDDAARDDERREEIRKRLQGSQACVTELRAAKVRAADTVVRLRGDLQRQRGERKASALALAQATVEAAAQDQSLGPTLRDAWRKLGISATTEQVRLLADEVEGVDGAVRRSRALLTRGAQYVAAAVAAAGLVLLVVGLAASGVLSRFLAGSGAATVVAALATFTVVTRRVQEGLATVGRLAEDIRRRREVIEADAVTAARKDLDDAEAREQVLQTELVEALARVGELDRELTDLSPGRRLYSFLAERSASDDYRRQMGLVAMIRRDFEQLGRLMRRWRADEQADVQPIDRIVLYIDDLDRCTPRQVVDVLQAVHLLLALDLFVVVVGVDPRWLVHSLRDQYRTLLTDPPAADPQPAPEDFLSTPLDYLEKIFNVPFVLPAMTTAGFETMIRRLSAPDADPTTAISGARTATVDPVAVNGNVAPDDHPLGPAGAVGPDVEAGSQIDQIRRGVAVPPAPMRESELTLLAALAPLVRSPREAKRLLNLYRMLRSTKDLSDAARFLGPRRADGSYPDGEYQAVAVLLGILTASRQLLGRLLFSPADPARGIAGGICARASDQTFHDVVEGLRPRRDANQWINDLDDDLSDAERLAWTTMLTRLEPALRLVHLADLTAFRSWGPHVARFSFLMAVPSADDATSRPGIGAAVPRARAG